MPPRLHYDPDRPWTRQPCDTDQDWPIFQDYLARRPPRPTSFRKLARAWGVGWTGLETTAGANGWAERARAWDAHLDGLRLDTAERYMVETGEEIAERHLEPVRKMIALGHRELAKYLAASESGEMPGLLTPAQVALFIRTGATLERLIMGESTAKVEVSGQAPDLSALSLEELRTLRDIQEKATRGNT